MIPTNMKAAVPTALDDASQKKLAKLRDTKPEDFSSEYDSMQVSAHKDAVSLFERYANGGDDPSLPRVLVLLTRLLAGVLPLLAPDLGRVDLALAGILNPAGPVPDPASAGGGLGPAGLRLGCPAGFAAVCWDFVCLHRFVLLCCRRRNRQCNSAVTVPISGASACCTGSGVNFS